MMDLLAKYSSNFPEKSSGVLRPARELKNVVVTGTTGSLGYYLLVSLLRDAHTGTIYCLNRSGEAKENFWTRYREREDKVEFHEGKVKFLKVSFGDELLGLDKESFNELLEEVDIIIHNAWKVSITTMIVTPDSNQTKGQLQTRPIILRTTNQRFARAYIHISHLSPSPIPLLHLHNRRRLKSPHQPSPGKSHHRTHT